MKIPTARSNNPKNTKFERIIKAIKIFNLKKIYLYKLKKEKYNYKY